MIMSNKVTIPKGATVIIQTGGKKKSTNKRKPKKSKKIKLSNIWRKIFPKNKKSRMRLLYAIVILLVLFWEDVVPVFRTVYYQVIGEIRRELRVER